MAEVVFALNPDFNNLKNPLKMFEFIRSGISVTRCIGTLIVKLSHEEVEGISDVSGFATVISTSIGAAVGTLLGPPGSVLGAALGSIVGGAITEGFFFTVKKVNKDNGHKGVNIEFDVGQGAPTIIPTIIPTMIPTIIPRIV